MHTLIPIAITATMIIAWWYGGRAPHDMTNSEWATQRNQNAEQIIATEYEANE